MWVCGWIQWFFNLTDHINPIVTCKCRSNQLQTVTGYGMDIVSETGLNKNKRKKDYSLSPVDGWGSSVQRQDGRVVDDGAVLGVIDDVHGDELGAEGHDVELGTHRLVGIHHLRDGLPLDPPPWELEHGSPVLLRRHRWKRRGEFTDTVQKSSLTKGDDNRCRSFIGPPFTLNLSSCLKPLQLIFCSNLQSVCK